MKKRILTILLSLCMVLSLTPAVAFAGENTSVLNGTPLTQELLAKCEKQEDEHSLFSRMVYKLEGGSIEDCEAGGADNAVHANRIWK